MSRSSPCFLKMPARLPMSGRPLSQLLGAPTASFSMSSAWLAAGRTPAPAAIKRRRVVRRVIRVLDHRSTPRASGTECSFGPNIGRLDDRPPLFDLGFLQGGKRLRRLLLARRNFGADIPKARAHRSIGHCLDERRI